MLLSELTADGFLLTAGVLRQLERLELFGPPHIRHGAAWRQRETCRGFIKDATSRSPFHGKCENPALAHPVSLLIDMILPSNLC